jgi:hypothetical protein
MPAGRPSVTDTHTEKDSVWANFQLCECVFSWGHTDRLGSDRHILGRNEVRVQGP